VHAAGTDHLHDDHDDTTAAARSEPVTRERQAREAVEGPEPRAAERPSPAASGDQSREAGDASRELRLYVSR
jgi:hypothetical protein